LALLIGLWQYWRAFRTPTLLDSVGMAPAGFTDEVCNDDNRQSDYQKREWADACRELPEKTDTHERPGEEDRKSPEQLAAALRADDVDERGEHQPDSSYRADQIPHQMDHWFPS
jgi:hypothetical protein